MKIRSSENAMLRMPFNVILIARKVEIYVESLEQEQYAKEWTVLGNLNISLHKGKTYLFITNHYFLDRACHRKNLRNYFDFAIQQERVRGLESAFKTPWIMMYYSPWKATDIRYPSLVSSSTRPEKNFWHHFVLLSHCEHVRDRNGRFIADCFRFLWFA